MGSVWCNRATGVSSEDMEEHSHMTLPKVWTPLVTLAPFFILHSKLFKAPYTWMLLYIGYYRVVWWSVPDLDQEDLSLNSNSVVKLGTITISHLNLWLQHYSSGFIPQCKIHLLKVPLEVTGDDVIASYFHIGKSGTMEQTLARGSR